MESKVTVFTNPEFGEIRTAGTPEEPMFCAADICRALGYEKPRNAVAQHVDEKDALKQGTPTQGGIQQLTFVNESGLYALIFGSKMPQAKEFKRWVTSEVLPSIRKRGAYITPGKVTEFLQRPESIIDILTALKTEQERGRALAEENAAQTVHIAELTNAVAEMAKKVSYYDVIISSPSLIMTTSIAQDYGMTANAFNNLLQEKRVQHRVGKQWVLYAPYLGKGYVASETIKVTRSDGTPKVVCHTKWTQSGRIFLYDLLKQDGVLPLIEKGVMPPRTA